MNSGGLKIKTYIQYLLPIFGIGIIFFLFRTLSLQMLTNHSYDDLTRLVYLPAGIRLLAVAIYGWIGILGIMLGWVFCHLYGEERTLLECIFLGLLSGATAYVSLRIWQWYYKINNSLGGLTSRLAISLVMISALISALVRFAYLHSVDPLTPFLSVFLIGLCGDILGSFVVLYVIKGGIYTLRRLAIA